MFHENVRNRHQIQPGVPYLVSVEVCEFGNMQNSILVYLYYILANDLNLYTCDDGIYFYSAPRAIYPQFIFPRFALIFNLHALFYRYILHLIKCTYNMCARYSQNVLQNYAYNIMFPAFL